MAQQRLLLPFTYGIDEQAIDNVLRFAKATKATIVALALILVPDQSHCENVRPELVQQATDFQEMMAARAKFYAVPVEHQECFTESISASTGAALQLAECQGLILIQKEQKPCLLQPDEAVQLQRALKVTFYNLHIPARQKAKKKLLQRAP